MKPTLPDRIPLEITSLVNTVMIIPEPPIEDWCCADFAVTIRKPTNILVQTPTHLLQRLDEVLCLG